MDSATAAKSEPIDIASFTSDSAMMIAYERALESDRGEKEALFVDPYAKTLATEKGEGLSKAFEEYAIPFGFADWPHFHKTWTAVRTRFIDDCIRKTVADRDQKQSLQVVNLGAGMDTRACRMECYREFERGFEVDLQKVVDAKVRVFEQLGAVPHCDNAGVAADLVDDRSLAEGLRSAGFESSAPSVFLAEGLIMYLREGSTWKGKDFISAVSKMASPGSTLILNFIGREEESEHHPGTATQEEMREMLEGAGWRDPKFSVFGDESLNFGRYPERFQPCKSFSFVVCTMGTT